ncbi:hypothetical protein ACVWXW_001663 [Thermostichus sp. MS-CIW-30]
MRQISTESNLPFFGFTGGIPVTQKIRLCWLGSMLLKF